MFDFLNTLSSENIQHRVFVDENTNKPKKFKDLDQKRFPYKIVGKVEPPKIFYKEGLLSADECEYLVWLAQTESNWPVNTIHPFWSERNIGLLTIIPKHKYQSIETIKLVLSVHQKIKEFVSKSFNVECYADQIGIVRWPPNSFQMVHVDEVPELSRVAGCVVYLNDDYEGGHTFYPYYDRENTPKTGAIFTHDPNHSHLHGVTRISGKTRYTISSTWSIKEEHSQYEAELSKMKSYLESHGQQELPVDKKC